MVAGGAGSYASNQLESGVLKGTLASLVTNQSLLREEVKATKASSSSLASQLVAIGAESSSLAADAAKVRSGIVPDPMGLQEALTSLGARVQTNRSALSSQSTQLQTLQAKVSHIARVHEKVSKRTTLLTSLGGELTATNQLRRCLSQLEETRGDLDHAAEENHIAEQSLSSNLAEAQTKLCALQSTFASSRTNAETTLLTVQQERAAIERQLIASKANRAAGENIIAAKKAAAAQAKAEHDKIMTKLKGKYAQLQTAVGEYHTKLERGMNEAASERETAE